MSQFRSNRMYSLISPATGLDAAASSERSLHIQNLRGVRLLREGDIQGAIAVLRPLVLAPGCTWTRPNAPNVYRRNFCTALLLAGHPSGCLDLLAEMRDDSHPRVQQMRAAIKSWEKTLSWLQWINWQTGRIEPMNHPVRLDFVPGEIEEDLRLPEATPSTKSANANLRSAI